MIIIKHIKKLHFILAAAMLLTSIKIDVYATNTQKDPEKLGDYITTATLTLEKIMKKDLEDMQEDIRDLVRKRGYDYSLTFNELMSEGNPFKDYDYIKLLAIYTASKKYLAESQSAGKSILDLHFLTYKVSDAAIDEPEYIKVNDYEALENGLYIKTGFHYTMEKQEVGIYEPLPGEYYYTLTGTKIITPKIKQTSYGKVEYTVATPDDILSQLNISFEDIRKDYQSALNLITQETDNQRLRQNTFLHLPQNDKVEDYAIPDNIDPFRCALLHYAKSLMGQVPYEWGGKASLPGYDPTWWTFDEKTGLQKGLDCSGFVQWAYLTAGAENRILNQLQSTNMIMNSDFKKISLSELQPGDIGVKKGVKVNHTGIYAGNGLWFHCSSESNTVVLSRYGFTFFYNPLETESDTPIQNTDMEATAELVIPIDKETNFISDNEISDRDVYLLAQLITHEAGNEGLNGWVGVGEVVVNRQKSDLFPNTIKEVIYQDNPTQFTKTGELSGITPRNEILEVSRQILAGKIKIFNDPDVLFFRNPQITSGIEPSEHRDWGELPYFDYIGKHAFYKRKK